MAESNFQDEPPQPLPRRPKPPRLEDEDLDEDRFRRDDDGISAIIPYKNPKSLVAYYCGVFALIPCAGLVLGPVALIFGILAVKYSKKHPTAGGFGHAITGIVLGTLTILLNFGALIVFFIGIGAAYYR